ncbi:MAG: Hsp20/alpha crystallin family protein [Anaerolineales bacterium]|nr:Hsp20/alpha crystallin family protein [Anaerolineales bacterium]
MKFKLAPWREENGHDSPLLSLRREIDRMFDEFDPNFEFPLLWKGEFPGRGERPFNPFVDIKETDEAVEVTAELPGMTAEDVEVTVKQNMLTLSGKKEMEKKEEKDNYYRMERSYGSFMRTIPFPADMVDMDKVEANFDNGVLKVVLPKLPEAVTEVKKIPIAA